MAKEKPAEKKAEKKTEEPKKSVKEHVQKHMNKNITIGMVVGVVLVLAVLFFPTKYEATEDYIDINEYEEEYQVTEPDLANPKDVEVCTAIPATVVISGNSTGNRPFGKGYRCEAKFKVTNQEDTMGEWTYRYIFNVNGKEFQIAPQTKEIAAISSLIFEFYSDECKQGDTLTGRMELVEGPTTQDCKYETQYDDITVTKTRLVTEEVPKQRIVTMTRPLWKKVLGVE